MPTRCVIPTDIRLQNMNAVGISQEPYNRDLRTRLQYSPLHKYANTSRRFAMEGKSGQCGWCTVSGRVLSDRVSNKASVTFKSYPNTTVYSSRPGRLTNVWCVSMR